jgi:hypothetical protein
MASHRALKNCKYTAAREEVYIPAQPGKAPLKATQAHRVWQSRVWVPVCSQREAMNTPLSARAQECKPTCFSFAQPLELTFDVRAILLVVTSR